MKAPCAEKLADEGILSTVYALPKVTNYLAQHRNWVRAAVLGRAKLRHVGRTHRRFPGKGGG